MPFRRLVSLLTLLALFLSARTATADTIAITAEQALVFNRSRAEGVVITQTRRGEKFDLISQNDEWFEVVLPPGRANERIGFIRKTEAAIDSVGPMSQAAREAATAAAGTGFRVKLGFLNVDVTYRLGRTDLIREATSDVGTVTGNYGNSSGQQFDVLGSAAIWGRWGIGGGVSYYTRPEATLRPPAASGQPSLPFAASAARELALHVPIVWMPVAGQRVKLLIFGGPTVVSLTQDVVERLNFGPASATPFGIQRLTGTALGYHVGGDVAYFFSNKIGLGGGVRYSAASVEFTEEPGTVWKVGGPQVSAGLRVRF